MLSDERPDHTSEMPPMVVASFEDDTELRDEHRRWARRQSADRSAVWDTLRALLAEWTSWSPARLDFEASRLLAEAAMTEEEA